MRRSVFLSLVLVLAACEIVPTGPGPLPGAQSIREPISTTPQISARSFVQVVERMEPVVERICRSQAPQANCDFQIAVDTRPGQPPNAFQTLDAAGRPIIAFTVALIAEAENVDELAFVLGHEAAHHIAGHLSRTRDTAAAGALIGGLLATLAGGDAGTIGTAQDFGASVGARTFSKDFELEADSLGTVITYRAGYNPERGALYFARIADPGNRFLGTHPPNAARVQRVQATLAALR